MNYYTETELKIIYGEQFISLLLDAGLRKTQSCEYCFFKQDNICAKYLHKITGTDTCNFYTEKIEIRKKND